MNVAATIRALLDHYDINQTALAKKLGGGISQPQVSRWLAGSTPELPNFNRIQALAKKAGLVDVRSEDVAADLAEGPRPRMVKLKGYVGAGSEAHFYRLADEDYTEVPAPEGATDQTIALEIKGASWGPVMESWLVFYKDVHSPVTPDLVGQTCVVGLADDRILVKKIARGPKGSYRLLSNSAEPAIENAEIEWAAKVTDMRPRS